MARYRLIDPAYETGYLGDVLLRPAAIAGRWVGVAEVDELPANLPPRVQVTDMHPEPDDQPALPDLSKLTVPELREMAAERGITTTGLRKAELIQAIEGADA
jgi:hypothetical protein